MNAEVVQAVLWLKGSLTLAHGHLEDAHRTAVALFGATSSVEGDIALLIYDTAEVLRQMDALFPLAVAPDQTEQQQEGAG